ncbi:membrane protein [Altererythrobacter sp. B11]|uniref:OmpA family protein n=1 Tax=Altererythrobacter sp. B11 TaxID=2060312 RepID=UPI000DC71E76|nr:OmpA family protein [Altererythrobacter sp. B11]BBC72229.1 membrane protein [Altererythrobacter sp. B11]
MAILRSPAFAIALGALATILLAVVAGQTNGPAMAARLSAHAQQVIASLGAAPVRADFTSGGLPSRHPLLSGGEDMDRGRRAKLARAIAAISGVGGIRWADGNTLAADAATAQIHPLHCQNDVEALLRARTIRFEESSARIDAASRELVDEVAAALRPCLGSIIAITGHTDSSGPEPGNLALSADRAEAVREALIARGIPADGLRVRGVGSRNPVPGLEPTDPANRRIEFSVIATEPVVPTPVDTPGPG